MRALMIRKVRDTFSNTGLVTYREHVAKESSRAGTCHSTVGQRVSPRNIGTVTGRPSMIGGMDKPTKIMSSEYDFIYVQEAIELTPPTGRT
jgi:hypothetical protein